jgi:hypothetical protein
MITSSLTPYDNTTDASFRAWSLGIHGAILGCGWITSSDLNQINLATAAHPTASSHFVGFNVYQMNDTLQSTAPVYMKVEYGAGNNQQLPQVAVTISNATDGNGSLIGAATAARKLCGGTVAASAGMITGSYYQSMFSGTTSRFTAALWASQQVQGAFGLFSVERSHDNSGQDTNAFIYVVYGTGGANIGTLVSQTLPTNPAYPLPPLENGITALLPQGITHNGTDTFVFAPGVPTIGSPQNPSICVGAVASSELGGNTGGIFYATHYGQRQRWYYCGGSALGLNQNIVDIFGFNNNFCIRWE